MQKIVSKSSAKKSSKKKQTRFLLDFVITFLGVFRRGEFENTIFLKSENTFDTVILLASGLPTYHGGHLFLFCCGPLVKAEQPVLAPRAPLARCHQQHQHTQLVFHRSAIAQNI
jgi:hypothetical protein